jgi:hypothetical protein
MVEKNTKILHYCQACKGLILPDELYMCAHTPYHQKCYDMIDELKNNPEIQKVRG